MNHGTAPMRRAPPAPAARTRPVTDGMVAWWRAAVRRPPPRLNLALQGGGAHGAFTWGVLDALLQDTMLQFEGLSGSSAGAMNAVVLADGWRKGGREGAQQALAAFWTAVGKQLPAGLVTQGTSDAIHLSAAGKMLASWAGWFSPTQLNPFDLNPLRDLLQDQVDFAGLRQASPFKLFIGATQARSGRLRVFREHELTVEVLLASACLPKVHHAVEIEGETYWDGGFAANPAVFPLFCDCDARDVLLVLLAPQHRAGTPRTREDIETRITELAFSTHFMREMRMFAQAATFARPGLLARLSEGRLDQRLRQMRFHLVDTSELGSVQRTETKMLAYGPFLERLHTQGRERGDTWLAAHAADVGRRSTVDIHARFG